MKRKVNQTLRRPGGKKVEFKYFMYNYYNKMTEGTF